MPFEAAQSLLTRRVQIEVWTDENSDSSNIQIDINSEANSHSNCEMHREISSRRHVHFFAMSCLAARNRVACQEQRSASIVRHVSMKQVTHFVVVLENEAAA